MVDTGISDMRLEYFSDLLLLHFGYGAVGIEVVITPSSTGLLSSCSLPLGSVWRVVVFVRQIVERFFIRTERVVF